MKTPAEDTRIVPGHCARTWQSCDYWQGRTHLFHERTYCRTLPRNPHRNDPRPASLAALAWLTGGSAPHSVQWFSGSLTEAEARAVCARNPGIGYRPEFYPAEDGPALFFLSCDDTDRALTFTHTADFRNYCATQGKIEESSTAAA